MDAKPHILIVEDDESIIELLSYNFENEGFVVSKIKRGDMAYKAVQNLLPDIIILDNMLPGLSGFEVCKQIKNDALVSYIPIVFLTVNNEEIDIINGLEIGAADYITKPFSVKVLITKIKNILKNKNNNSATSKKNIIQYKTITIDLEKHSTFLGQEKIELTATEFAILKYLLSSPGRVFSRDNIINGTKGSNYVITERTIDVHIAGLRKKLKNLSDLIESVRGVGYKIKE